MGALLGFMLGYVLGAKEGPERFDELRKAWETIVNSEEFKGMLATGASIFQSTFEEGKLSVAETLGSMLSGNGHLAETIMGFSGNRPLMDAWQTLSKSPEIQALIANGVAMIGGLMMQGRSAMRE
jgi:hypothetical protein